MQHSFLQALASVGISGRTSRTGRAATSILIYQTTRAVSMCKGTMPRYAPGYMLPAHCKAHTIPCPLRCSPVSVQFRGWPERGSEARLRLWRAHLRWPVFAQRPGVSRPRGWAPALKIARHRHCGEAADEASVLVRQRRFCLTNRGCSGILPLRCSSFFLPSHKPNRLNRP